ncbi:MAG: DUF1882 domain-containing protein [Sulfurimonadaceae bacterium]
MISTLFPLIRDHYWLKHPKIIQEITFEGRTFLSKYEKIDTFLSDELIEKHRNHKITIATTIPSDANYFVFDYNGDEKELFYHKLSKILRSLDLNDFTAYESKTPSHLHLYVYCGDISAPQREELGKIISNKLEEKLQKQWRIFPNSGLPDAYNILNLPYHIFKG